MALEHAERLYVLSISAIRRQISELSNENINEAIAATMLMAAYDVCLNSTDCNFDIP